MPIYKCTCIYSTLLSFTPRQTRNPLCILQKRLIFTNMGKMINKCTHTHTHKISCTLGNAYLNMCMNMGTALSALAHALANFTNSKNIVPSDFCRYWCGGTIFMAAYARAGLTGIIEISKTGHMMAMNSADGTLRMNTSNGTRTA